MLYLHDGCMDVISMCWMILWWCDICIWFYCDMFIWWLCIGMYVSWWLMLYMCMKCLCIWCMPWWNLCKWYYVYVMMCVTYDDVMFGINPYMMDGCTYLKCNLNGMIMNVTKWNDVNDDFNHASLIMQCCNFVGPFVLPFLSSLSF